MPRKEKGPVWGRNSKSVGSSSRDVRHNHTTHVQWGPHSHPHSRTAFPTSIPGLKAFYHQPAPLPSSQTTQIKLWAINMGSQSLFFQGTGVWFPSPSPVSSACPIPVPAAAARLVLHNYNPSLTGILAPHSCNPNQNYSWRMCNFIF